MRFLNGFSFDDGKRTRKANRGAHDNETSGNGGREGGRAGDIYREIKKSREKLSVTGARPCPRLNST
jgi:hypothetical protein